ncbi:MAG: hypothetical protein HYY92_01170 [Parcubacteria group bacterium]|nr:hypothetical protein [Parcubacteria group bacterium]
MTNYSIGKRRVEKNINPLPAIMIAMAGFFNPQERLIAYRRAWYNKRKVYIAIINNVLSLFIMFKPLALAHSLAALVAVFFVVLYALQVAAPALFKLIFNAQFYGADIAKLVPKMTFGDWVGILVVCAVTAWVAGYAWAWLYNYFAKK